MQPAPQRPKATGPIASDAQKKTLRFKLGLGLLALYVVMWIVAAIVPFLPLDLATKAAVVAGDLAAAEVIGLVGIACVGKETYQAIKGRFRKRRRPDGATESAEAK